MKKIFEVILLVSLVSCNNQKPYNDLDYQFINSFTEIDSECIGIISKILEPYYIEDDSIKISRVFNLDVEVDTTIYSPEELKNNYFFGVLFNPDLYELMIFNIDLNIGAIMLCEISTDEELIINNTEWLFTNLLDLKNCDTLIPDSLIQSTEIDEPYFHVITWASYLYGKWKIDMSKNHGFTNNKYNNTWIFKREKGLILLDSKNDTILTDIIELQGYYLDLIESETVFEIGTMTKNKILIKEEGADNYNVLIKEK